MARCADKRGAELTEEAILSVNPLFGDKDVSRLDSGPLGAMKEVLHAAIHSAVDSPYKGFKQLVHHGTGVDLPNFQLSGDVEAAPIYSQRWHAQQVGGAIGMILPFCLVAGGLKGLRSVTARVFQHEAAATGSGLAARSFNSRFTSPIADSAVAGFVFDSTLRPVQPEEGDFWAARLRNGTCGAITFATLTAGTLGLQEISKRQLSATPWMVHSFGRDVSRHFAAGAIAGGIDAQCRSLSAGKGLADLEHTLQSAYTFAIVGGALRTKQEVFGSIREQKTLSEIVGNDKALQTKVAANENSQALMLEYGGMRVRPEQLPRVERFLRNGDFKQLNQGLQPTALERLASRIYWESRWKLSEGALEAKRLTYSVLNQLNMRHPLQRLGDAWYGTESGIIEKPPELTPETHPLKSFSADLNRFYADIRANNEKFENCSSYKEQHEILKQQRAIRTDFAYKLLHIWHGSETSPGMSRHSDAELATEHLPASRVAQIRAALMLQANGGELSRALAELAPESSKDLPIDAIDLHDGIAGAKEKFFGYDELALQKLMSMPGLNHYKDHDPNTPADWCPSEPSPLLSHFYHGSVSNSLSSILTERGMLPGAELRLRGIEQSTGETALSTPKYAISLTRDFNEAWAYHRHSPAYLTGFPVIYGTGRQTASKARSAGCAEPGELLVDHLRLGRSSLLTRIGLLSPDITNIYVPDGQVTKVEAQLKAKRVPGVQVIGLGQLKAPKWSEVNPEELGY